MPASTATTRLRYAFALESTLNLLGGITMLTYPSAMLSLLVSHPTLITNAAVSLTQWLGALSCGLAVPLLLALPESPQAPAQRKLTYSTLLAGEGFLIPVMLLQAAGARDATGLTRKALVGALQVLVPPAVGRLYVLVRRPEWFGGGETAAKRD
ncbi:hypothetical protein BDV95DRAFT_564454 [Massariosphaeria phaeospora]|uniref:Uncharacterized protein n=1 Tax=Massariosphaeria phaeospora TaxID=100035 RepID=A0A7C8IB45_9PLEO|nr:hypothetical protein BDV95DRAFT_564454 [Massariosphaeria phaeospora]